MVIHRIQCSSEGSRIPIPTAISSAWNKENLRCRKKGVNGTSASTCSGRGDSQCEYDAERNEIVCELPQGVNDFSKEYEIYADNEFICDATEKHCKCTVVNEKEDSFIQSHEKYESNHDLPASSNTTVSASSLPVIKQLSFLDRFLSLWIITIMIIGVVVGKYAPGVRNALNSTDITTVSLPVAMGLWLVKSSLNNTLPLDNGKLSVALYCTVLCYTVLTYTRKLRCSALLCAALPRFMMWPVLIKVKYESLLKILKHKQFTKQVAFSLLANWIVGPFLMLGTAWATLPDLPDYRAGVIMVGLARCIAMVLIWNQLSNGDPEFCAILVVINSILQIILYSPLALFFLQVISRQYLGGSQGQLNLSFWTVCRSVLLFLGVPLIAAIITRYAVLYAAGKDWFEKKFVPVISPVALIALLWTIFAIFCLQADQIISNIGDVCRVAVPMVIYFAIMWTVALFSCRYMGFGYERSVTQAFTASSNNFELAIAVAAGTFGINSQQALAATVGPRKYCTVLHFMHGPLHFLIACFTCKCLCVCYVKTLTNIDWICCLPYFCASFICF
jgi:ACR3 family arsenite transporter